MSTKPNPLITFLLNLFKKSEPPKKGESLLQNIISGTKPIQPSSIPVPQPKQPIEDYIRQNILPAADKRSVQEYYPRYDYIRQRAQETEKEFNKPGAADLMTWTALNESQMGNDKNILPYNYWGMRAAPQYNWKGYNNEDEAVTSYKEHLSGKRGYMNPILLDNPGKPITKADIKKLYESYNPEGAYLDNFYKMWDVLHPEGK